MTAATTARSISDALAEVEQWRADAEAQHQAEILDTDQEIKNLQSAIENLQHQLDVLNRFRSELGTKVRELGTHSVGRAYQSVYDVLKVQAQWVADREKMVATASEARRLALPEMLGRSEVGPVLDEYNQFKTTVEPTLKALPESYRSVILRHHQGVTDRLRDHVAAVLTTPITIDAEECTIDVVYAVDAPEGEPELLIVVLPVPMEVHDDKWAERPDGLSLWIAARVVQAVYEAAAGANFARAKVTTGGHLGLLVIEVDLAGAGMAFVELLEKQIQQVLGQAPELGGARIRIAPRQLKIDNVLPPDEGMEVADA